MLSRKAGSSSCFSFYSEIFDDLFDLYEFFDLNECLDKTFELFFDSEASDNGDKDFKEESSSSMIFCTKSSNGVGFEIPSLNFSLASSILLFRMLRDSKGSTSDAEIIMSSSLKELSITVVGTLLRKFVSEGT